MKIYLSPVRTNAQLTASVSGDTITVNGDVLDFTPLLEGETLPRTAVFNDWIIGDVHRIAGEITLTLRLPHGANAPEETRFPDAYIVPITVASGDVPLPPYDEVL
jgi:hypothetical protein